MKRILALLALLAPAAGSLAQNAASLADVTAGRTALANQDPATADSDFAAAVAADPTNQTAQALLGFASLLALPGQPAAQQYLDGLGVTAAGRNIYNPSADFTRNSQGQIVLPAGYNLSTALAYFYNVMVPATVSASANFAAVTDQGFLLSLTAAETGSTAVNIDYGDILMCNALLNAFDCDVEISEGQNLNANLADIVQLGQGDMLTLQHVLTANPSLLQPGSATARTAAQQSLLNAIQLYEQASAFIRARPAGVSRLFMLEPSEAAAEATFRSNLSQVQQAITSPVAFGPPGHTATLAPLFTPTWSAQAELPPVTGNTFNYSQIPDPTFGGVLSGYTVAELAAEFAPPPSFTLQPSSQTVASGSTAVLSSAAVSAAPVTYQWYRNGLAIAGATSSQLVLSAVTTANAGQYFVTATDAAGTVTSTSGVLSVSATSDPGHLVNLAILSDIQGSLSMGFVTGGSGTSGTEPLLIRGVGPSIGPGTAFGVPGVITDPTLTVVQQSSGTTVASNAGWGSNQAAVTAADTATGAFALTNPASLDSAVVVNLPASAGGYTATVAGKSGDSGWALTEVYDATSNYTVASPRLVNLSCLTQIATGGTLDVGFVIGGSTAKTLLIRVGGPALSTLFGIGTAMADPQLQVSPLGTASEVLAANAGWGGNTQIATVATDVGAYAFPSPASLDSAVVVTLAPGAYTAAVDSVSGAGGTVLVEIYDVP